MPAPEPSDSNALFDLAAISQELRNGGHYVRNGLTAQTLMRSPDLRVVLVSLKAGKKISEHHAAVTASVQTLAGHVRLQLPDHAVDVSAGELLVLGAGLPHDVHAEVDSTFLLTLGWPAGDP